MSIKVTFKWKDGADLTWFIDRLNATRTQENSKVRYRGGDYSFIQSVLHSFIRSSRPVRNDLVAGWLSAALFAPTKTGRVTASGLLKQAGSAAVSYYNFPKRTYYLESSLSYQYEPPITWTVADDARVYLKVRPSKFSDDDPDLMSINRQFESLQLPRNFPKFPTVAARVSGRSKHEAHIDAMDALDLVRGLSNLITNRGTQIRWSSGGRQPVNRLRLGPLHILRDEKGRVASSTFWYEPEFVQPHSLVNLSKHLDQIRKILNVYRSNYKKPLAAHARSGIIQYVRALDRRDWGVSFLELWGALEYLTRTQNDPYKVTIRRAASLYQNANVARQVLSHLRDVRNGVVHKFEDRPDSETLMYQLKNFVEWMLHFYIYNPFHLKSLDEAIDFLDLPPDVDLLKQRRRILLSAIDYRIGKAP